MKDQSSKIQFSTANLLHSLEITAVKGVNFCDTAAKLVVKLQNFEVNVAKLCNFVQVIPIFGHCATLLNTTC